MKIEIKNFDAVTPEKAEYIEQQAEKVLEFTMDSRAKLTAEAHTTLNWLFAIIVGTAGYVVTLLEHEQGLLWWLIVPLAGAAAASACQAVRLFQGALQTLPVLPLGNDPKNLLVDELITYDLEWIRVAELSLLQERIDKAREHN